jgi:dTDP-4-amino-4,6-dideoxygalactose transaminase
VVGVNSRLDSIQAAVLDIKLKHLDSYNKARREAANKYNEAFKNIAEIETPFEYGSQENHVFHQYTLKLKGVDRDALVKFLNENDIPCGVYYPIPLHKQKAYKDTRYNEANFTVTNQLVKNVISLPMHTELDDEQIAFISGKIIQFING